MTALDEIKNMLEAWDSGRSVWTIEMGGLGPGYEQALQICMVEICRAALKEPRQETETDDLYQVRFMALCDKVVREIDTKCGGFSGAQVGAANQLAFRFVRDGIQESFDSFKRQRPEEFDKRHIQISSYWPQAPKNPIAKEECGAVDNGLTTATVKNSESQVVD
jgi:hypothetical protein